MMEMKKGLHGKEIYEAKKDPQFQKPYVDVDEWKERELPDGTKVPYRYVHGGFEDTGVKFLFCFPEQDEFKGRFFHYLSPFPGPDEEVASLVHKGELDRIAFSLLNGAYFVESNMGSTAMFGAKSDPQMVWKSSAAVAEYSRTKAMEIYGCARPYGYVHGGSGGGYKTMACIENTDAWDGAVPFVIGSPASLPNTITLHVQGQRTLRHVFGKIVDALDAGGSGNMYEGLTEDEREMLKEVTAMGFPPQAWYLEADGLVDPGSLPVLTPGVKMSDAVYFQEFWEKEGYAGADLASNAVRDRLQFKTVVKSVHIPGEKVDEKEGLNGVDDAWKKMMADGKGAWIELEDVPVGGDLYLEGVNIGFETGDAVGKLLLLGELKGNYATIGMCYGMDDLPGVLSLVKPGDVVTLDNSDYIAIQHYYRHQVPADTTFHAWDQFRNEDGTPKTPQRNFMGYGFTGTGTVQDGNLQGKVIVVQSLLDESTCPWCGDWYRQTVKRTMGNEESFRIYYMERCMHGDQFENNMVTSYRGAVNQALLDVSDWAERGIEPRKSTVYEMIDNQVYPAKTAAERKGVQPTVELLANGGTCAHVKAGEEVTFTANVLVPENAGEVTSIAFSFEASHEFRENDLDWAFPCKGEVRHTLENGLYGANASASHVYEKPGTYFASARVCAERGGDAGRIYTQVKNLARVRVIVE